jgi:hypothetical protein
MKFLALEYLYAHLEALLVWSPELVLAALAYSLRKLFR